MRLRGKKSMANSNYQNIAKAKAIENQNKNRLLAVNPKLNERSGIYFLLRTDENGFKYAYIGQARSVIRRLCSHMSGYKQHIDLSLRKHKLYDKDNNPYGWRVEFLNFPESQLDEKEKYYIKLYADKGYQLRNVSVGGQGSERDSGTIGERKPPKGYRDGIKQGYKNASKEISHLFDLHLDYKTKSDNPNKNQEKALHKLEEFLNYHKGDSENE